MFEVGVVTQFEATHRLRGDFGAATDRHGHAYRVETAARGRSLRRDGTLCDIAALQRTVDEVVAGLRDRDLGDIPAFRESNSTAEALAQYLFQEVASRLNGQGLAALVVRVWESPQAYASFEADLSSE